MVPEIINNRYQILKKIGSGEIGEVYKVKDLKKKSVLALKLLSKGFTEYEDPHRFRLEFQTLSQLDHPNVMKVFDYGESVDQRLFFTMEYLDGQNIKELFKEKVDFNLLYSLMMQICDALTYIHRRKLIHSDIKPDNVLILKDQTLKLLDFSLVGPIDLRVPKSIIKGTLPYIAPELPTGVRADERSDLYSLGVLLYELVTGVQPFKGKEPLQIIRQHIEKRVKPPSRYNSDIPEEFEELILKLIEKEPENRYASADELAYDIGKIAGKAAKIKERRQRLLNPKFVGRQAEFNKLKEKYEETKRSNGLVVLIGGEAGIGKTRLMQELRFMVQLDGSKCMTSKCVPEDIPYKPFVEPIVEIVGYLEPSNTDIIRRFGSELIRIIPSLIKKEYMKGKEVLPKLPAKSEMLRLFDYITEFLTESTKKLGPIILLIEDMHLAGNESIDLLGYLARNIKKSKLLVCATYRSEEVIGKLRLKEIGFEGEAHPLVAMSEAEKENIRKMELERLDLKSTDSIICSMLGVAEFEHKATQEIFERTGGNPLFIQAMMDSLLKEQILVYEYMQWKIDMPKLKSAQIPEKVGRIIRTRLGRLSEDTLEQLSAAAIIGKKFSLDILGKLGEWSTSKVYGAVKEGIRESLIEEIRAQGRLGYDFIYPLIRELLYVEVEPVVRRELHQKIGELLEEYNGCELDIVVEQLAYHYSNGKDKNKAVKYLYRAANKAKKEYANDKAIEYFKKLLKLIQKVKKERAKVLEELADIYALQGFYEKALPRYNLALSKISDPTRTATIYRKIGDIYERTGKYNKALEVHELGIALMDGKEYQSELSRLYGRLGWTHYLKGAYKEAIRAAEKGLSIAEMGGFLSEHALALNTLGNVYRIKGDYKLAANCLKTSLNIRKGFDNPYDLMASYNNLGLLRENKGEWDSAINYYEKGLELAHKIGDMDGQAMLYNNLGIVYKNKGAWSESQKCYERSLKLRERMADVKGATYPLENLGILLKRKGELDKAQECYERGLKIEKESKAPYRIAMFYEHLGELCLEKAAWGQAFSYLKDGLKIFEKLGIKSEQADVLALLGELYFRNNDYGKSIEACEKALLLAKEIGATLTEATTRRVIGSTYGATGEDEKAKESFVQSIKLLKKLGAGYELGKAMLAVGSWILDRELGDWTIENMRGFMPLLTRAKGIFERLGARLDLEKTAKAIEKGRRVALGLPEKPDKLTSLYEISQNINSILDREQLLTKLMDIVNIELKAERGLILLMDEKTHELNPEIARNLERETIDDAKKISYGVIQEMMRGGKPILTSNAIADPRFKEHKSIMLFKIKSIMCVPLRIRDKVIGAIYMDSRIDTHIFNEEDLKFFGAFANIAAIAIENATLHSRLMKEFELLKQEVKERYRFGLFIGKNKVMQDIYSIIEKVSKSDVSVLVQGETGTGKELVAKTVHYKSKRKDHPFVVVNCSAIPEELLESELFGYVRGAFTEAVRDKPGLFEEAQHGTIFLDEIGELSPKLQAKLLRALEDGELRRLGDTKNRIVDVRVIAATSKNLETEIESKKFRDDLYYRINVMTVNLPPLRGKREDIPLLASHFLREFAKRDNKEIEGFEPTAMEPLIDYNWPGNVRELKNEIERAVALTSKGPITLHVLSPKLKKSAAKAFKPPVASRVTLGNLKQMVEDLEKSVIKEALKKCNGNKSNAAKLLGLTRKGLRMKISRYELE